MNKLDDLAQFTGTSKYYRTDFYPFLFTDGIKYIAENGEAFWLLDAIASWQEEPIIKNDTDLNRIQFWRLTVFPDRSAVLDCERDLDDVVISQPIPYTDFPLDQIMVFLCDMGTPYGVLILPSEY